MATRTLVLVYPAYSTPTSPPLGVCWLKGFVERTHPDWRVRVMDLNLALHQRMFRSLSRQSYASSVVASAEGITDDTALLCAEAVFRGQSDNEFFNQPDWYTYYADLWLQATYSALADFPLLEQAYRDQRPMPPQVLDDVERVLAEQPAAVGISVGYTQQMWFGLCVAKSLKKRAGLPIIMGGTFFNNDANTDWALRHECVDCIVRGEGEHALAQFLSAGMKPDRVPGLTYRQNGQIVANAPVHEEDLDRLGPPDFSDLDLRAYYSPRPVLPISTSRGCYWRRCAFCVHYKSAGQTYRCRGISEVVDELKRHADGGVRHFALIDEMISPAYFSRLADAILAAGLKVYYYAMAKPVKQFDRELLGKLHQSGCRYLMWGVESGSQRVLDLMAKGTVLSEVEGVLESAREAAIKNHVFIMAGFPTETRQEFQATMDLLARHKDAIAAVHRGIFHLEEGSPILDQPEKFSITQFWPVNELPMRFWYEFQCLQGMNGQDIRQAFAEALPFLRSFQVYSRHLAYFRDHALLIYSHLDP